MLLERSGYVVPGIVQTLFGSTQPIDSSAGEAEIRDPPHLAQKLRISVDQGSQGGHELLLSSTRDNLLPPSVGFPRVFGPWSDRR